jgi:hypothetical protein
LVRQSVVISCRFATIKPYKEDETVLNTEKLIELYLILL